jgi:hypothetical protein
VFSKRIKKIGLSYSALVEKASRGGVARSEWRVASGEWGVVRSEE